MYGVSPTFPTKSTQRDYLVFLPKDFLNWKNYLNDKVDSLSTYFVKQNVNLLGIFITKVKRNLISHEKYI
jgi:hypothetical protein